MRQNRINGWKYTSDLNTMLFFAQRLDELLFHHSIDSYRYPVLSLESLCSEYLRVYRDVKSELINEANLKHIIEELTNSLKSDPVAINVLSKEYTERFISFYGAWSIKEQYDNVFYISRKLGNFTYYNGVIDLLKKNIKSNTGKRLVDKYAAVVVRLLIDYGYDENFIYKTLHNVFFWEPVISFESLDNFFNTFDFKRKKYNVYIGFSKDVSKLFPLFQGMRVDKLTVSMIDVNHLPLGIKAKGQKTIIRFEGVESLDIYSAYTLVQTISDFIVNSYGFYSHMRNGVKRYGQVVDDKGNVTTINRSDLLKDRVSSSSHEESSRNANNLLKITFSSYRNLEEISKLTEIHNSAVYSNNTSDSLLSLWSILESQAEDDKEKDKITCVKENVIPFLKSTYIEKLVSTVMADIRRWNRPFFEETILNNNFGVSDLEHTFAFLTFDEFESDRKKLYSLTEEFPLLRNRVYILNAQLKNTKGYKSLIKEHVQRIGWQLHRIYRARNYIIHDGTRNDDINRELVINLHSYVDTMFLKVFEMIGKSPYRDSIESIVISHKLSVLIMDEQLKEQEKTNIDRDNALKYLYYDFER